MIRALFAGLIAVNCRAEFKDLCGSIVVYLMKSNIEKEVNISTLPRVYTLVVTCLLMFMLTTCHGGIPGSALSFGRVGTGEGTLLLNLTDAQSEELEAIYITINEVCVHIADDVDGKDSNWEVVASPYTTYNLLTLVNGGLKTLGVTKLKSGLYTEIKLIIGNQPDDSDMHPYANYIKDDANKICRLEVPSALQTGVKLIHPFEINEGQSTELILDFDASKSIVKTGNAGEHLLQPVIEVIDTSEHAVVRGRITDGKNGLQGVRVSAQKSDPGSNKTAQVVIRSMTTTDEDGYYTMYLKPDKYNIVAYKGDAAGYSLSYMGCTKIIVEPNTSYTQDLVLSPAMSGNLTSIVTIDGLDDQREVTISFRKMAVDGSAGTEQIEVTSVSVTGGMFYTVS